jgi:7-carboxy-7-deazaguanine synthase
MTKLNITEIFHSVQGETTFVGLPTTFIRLSACNLRCTWCDTTYSFKRGTSMELEEIVAIVEKNGSQHVCVTGGEPLLQEGVISLMETLSSKGFIISLETSGSLSIAKVPNSVYNILDIKCPGSGMEDKNHWPNIGLLKPQDEVKFVLLDRADYDYAKNIIYKYRLDSKVNTILLSPVHGELCSQKLVAWILEDRLPVRLNLQIHKTIWTPTTMGV